MIRSPRAYMLTASLALGLGGLADPVIPGRRDAFGRQKDGAPSRPAKYRQGPGQDRREKRYVRKGLRP